MMALTNNFAFVPSHHARTLERSLTIGGVRLIFRPSSASRFFSTQIFFFTLNSVRCPSCLGTVFVFFLRTARHIPSARRGFCAIAPSWEWSSECEDNRGGSFVISGFRCSVSSLYTPDSSPVFFLFPVLCLSCLFLLDSPEQKVVTFFSLVSREIPFLACAPPLAFLSPGIAPSGPQRAHLTRVFRDTYVLSLRARSVFESHKVRLESHPPIQVFVDPLLNPFLPPQNLPPPTVSFFFSSPEPVFYIAIAQTPPPHITVSVISLNWKDTFFLFVVCFGKSMRFLEANFEVCSLFSHFFLVGIFSRCQLLSLRMTSPPGSCSILTGT